jgi:hypothetical protein
MVLIDTTQAAAAALIAAIAVHIPHGQALGRIGLVSADSVVTADGEHRQATWSVDDAGAVRVARIDASCVEVTRWYWGEEESRAIIRADIGVAR